MTSSVLPEGADDVGRSEGTTQREGYTKSGKLKAAVYDAEMERLQEQLVLLQYWIQSQGLKVLVIELVPTCRPFGPKTSHSPSQKSKSCACVIASA